jgi:hypothetical protein
MDPALLEALGKAAGIGGLALGVFLVIFRNIIRKNIFPRLPAESAYRVIRLILVLTFLISALGIGAWIYVTVGTASLHGAVDEAEVKKTFQQIGGTGWILLGNYDSDKGVMVSPIAGRPFRTSWRAWTGSKKGPNAH